METRRLILFSVLSLLIFIAHAIFTAWWNINHPAPVAAKPDANAKAVAGKAAPQEAGKAGNNDPAKPANADPNKPEVAVANPAAPAVNEPNVSPAWFTLGSFGTAENPDKMLVTLNNRGATIERVELNGYPMLEDHLAFGESRAGKLWHRSGYLGQLAPTIAKENGVLVNVVGPGTPAAVAGLKPGDVIQSIASEKSEPTLLKTPLELHDFLMLQKPETTVLLKILRNDKEQTISVPLAWQPASVIRPEQNMRPLSVMTAGQHDPLSLGLHLSQIDKAESEVLKEVLKEIPAAELLEKYWQGRQVDPNTVEFSRDLSGQQLRVVKRYQLLPTVANPEQPAEANPTGYEIDFQIILENTGDATRKLAYQLDGPNGMPIEGWWYAYKNRIGTAWGQSLGLRDVALRLEENDASLIGAIDIANNPASTSALVSENQYKLAYAGLDCQYFSAVLIPQRSEQELAWFESIRPRLLSPKPAVKLDTKLVNVTCQLNSLPLDIPAQGKVLHRYHLYVGPKQPTLLNQVGTKTTTLDRLVYFGWYIFSVPAHLLLSILHFFHRIIPNYGINIIMLTIFVRLCLFPISRKQALSAAIMQKLQPQMKAINEKYKDKPEERGRKIQELFRANNYNPFGGCLMAFFQMPIFMGLYRALMIDVELRAAPLFGEHISWCSNLSAPDKLFYWGESFLPEFLVGANGYLGPYFNVLPLFTVGLFLVQQKAMMPPATDEQTEMQQSIMKFMTLFMGLMFYTVASGLCLYFIVSSLWGILERRFLKQLTTDDKHNSYAALNSDSPVLEAAPITMSEKRKERNKRR